MGNTISPFAGSVSITHVLPVSELCSTLLDHTTDVIPEIQAVCVPLRRYLWGLATSSCP
jgi:hypothetical protein